MASLVTDDVGAVAQALATAFKAFDDLFLIVNSPTMLDARQRADVQAILNAMDRDLKAAHTTGDISKIDAESSG